MCINCKLHAHTGLSCDEAKQKSNPLDQAFLTLANENNWRKCEKCGRMIELSYGTRTPFSSSYSSPFLLFTYVTILGCNHMTCSCKYEFCFVCGSKWNPRECTCPLFTEEFLERAVEERRPANNIERVRISFLLLVLSSISIHSSFHLTYPYIANALRNRAECRYHTWQYDHSPRVSSCENCGYQLWVYGYVSTLSSLSLPPSLPSLPPDIPPISLFFFLFF